MKFFRLCTICLLLLFTFAPSTAMAQEEDFVYSLLFTVSILPLSGLVLGGLTTSGGVMFTASTASKSNAKMEMYLRGNEVAVMHDLTTGSGGSINDLASAFGVKPKHKPAFAKMLRSNRKVLLALSDVKKLNKNRAQAFVTHILHSMHNTPELRHLVSSK